MRCLDLSCRRACNSEWGGGWGGFWGSCGPALSDAYVRYGSTVVDGGRGSQYKDNSALLREAPLQDLA